MSGFSGIKDCSNVPRKMLLHNFYKAVFRGETGYQIRWEFPALTFENDEAGALKYLAQFHAARISQLTLLKTITHGPEAAVTGSVISDILQNTQYHIE